MTYEYEAVAFFDIGETLGSVQVDPRTGDLLRIDLLPSVRGVLADLRGRGVLLGIISNTGDIPGARVDDVLAAAGILHFFEQQLRIYSADVGLTKDSAEIFELAIGRAAAKSVEAARRCIFVGESRAERQLALLAGMRVAPHVRLASAALKGEQYQIFRVRLANTECMVRLNAVLEGMDAVPVYMAEEETGVLVLLQATAAAAIGMQRRGFDFEALPAMLDGATHDYYLLRKEADGAVPQTADFADSDVRVCDDLTVGRLVALGPAASIDDFHCGSSHGHNFKLLCDESLVSAWAEPIVELFDIESDLSDEEAATIAATVSEASYLDMLDRVTGKNPDWPGIGDNRHVVGGELDGYTQLLAAEFDRIGLGKLQISAHQFAITGKDVRDVRGLPIGQRINVSNVIAELAGETDELVLVTAHLDSTAASTYPPHVYDPRKHSAPGVDDDGSGVAGVLLVAETMARLFAHRKPHRTYRFILFTAEEQGLIGSERYARMVRGRGERIAAVLQMDMIGYNLVPPNSFETHFGVSSEPLPSVPPVEERSGELAELVACVADALAARGLSMLAPAQLYGSPDGAAGRSDHASFQRRNYPACVTSEDFFPDPGRPAEANPNYHKATDLVVSIPYATSISRVIAASALRLGQPATLGANAVLPVPLSREGFAADGTAVTGKREVHGHVRDQASGAALPHAKVTLHTFGTDGERRRIASAEADSEGEFAATVESDHPFYVVVHDHEGICVDATHEVPVPACSLACSIDFAVGNRGTHLDRTNPRHIRLGSRWRIFDDGFEKLTPDAACEMARAIARGEPAEAASTAFVGEADINPGHTLCGTERLEELFALIASQHYANEDDVLRRVNAALGMSDLGFAQQLYLTDNFEIRFYLEGEAAVVQDYEDYDVYEPGVEDGEPIATLPGGVVPAYVRLVGFWLERSLQTYTQSPFALRNPAANGRLRVFITATQFGSATPDAFYISNRLTPAFVCAVSVHELFHMVQYGYDGSGVWRHSVFEGGATFAEDFLADRMNRYILEAGTAFNGAGLLANPNQSLFSVAARYKSALFWRYLAEQRGPGAATGPVTVASYRRVIEECAQAGYTTEAVRRAVAGLAGGIDLYRFRYLDDDRELLDSAETTFGNFSLACILKELGDGVPDRRFDFAEDEEDIHFDDALRELMPGTPRVDRLVEVKRRQKSLTAGEAVSFVGQVNALASEYMEITVAPNVNSIELRFDAGPQLTSSIFQIVLIDENGGVRDILRSDRAHYSRRVANSIEGTRLSHVICIVSGGATGGRYGVTLSPAEPTPDVAITRWNSAAGHEYELPSRDWHWSWMSPDLWSVRDNNGGSDGLRVFVRLHNKGNEEAAGISVDLFYRSDSGQGEWQPVRDSTGSVQRPQGLALAAGHSGTWSVAWTPTPEPRATVYTLMARVHVPGDANVDNKVAMSSMLLAEDGDFADEGTAMLPQAKADGRFIAVARGDRDVVNAQSLCRWTAASRYDMRPGDLYAGPRPLTFVALPAGALPELLQESAAVTVIQERSDASLRGFTIFHDRQRIDRKALADD